MTILATCLTHVSYEFLRYLIKFREMSSRLLYVRRLVSSFLKMTLLPTIPIGEMVFANEIMPYFFAPYANIYRKMHRAAHQKEFREKLLFSLHRRQQRHRFAILLLLFNSKEKRSPAVLPF